MDLSSFNNPGMAVALALSMGMIAHALAHHLRIPGIVLLLTSGVIFGPDGLGLIQPASLGSALNILTGFAVAVILFEGGMHLKFTRLKHVQRSIRRLIFLGGAITVVGAALAVHYVMGWPWKSAFLFGTLVMVTGPTVINPLLKRLKVKRSIATVLEAEGILIDALGAVVAAVALETALGPEYVSPLVWVGHVFGRIGFGSLLGAIMGGILLLLYRVKRLIPEGSVNVFTLSMIMALFQISNLLMPESGIAAVTVAGIVIGNFCSHKLDDLLDFKEELTILFIGMLFVLLAADVRLEQVVGLGWPAVIVVVLLMLVIRPVAVMAGTSFSKLNWRERVFIAWIGPRGIVAAAAASFFAATFAEMGLPGGYELRALVFLVIAVTVITAGLTGGFVAGVLGLRRPSQQGWVLLGASELARGLAKILKENGQEVICIDSNVDHTKAAENDCTRIIYGNGLQQASLLRAEIDTRMGAIAITANDEINYLFTQKVKEESRDVHLWTTLNSESTSLTSDMIHKTSSEVSFGAPVDVELWNRRFVSKQVHQQLWLIETPAAGSKYCDILTGYAGKGLIAAVLVRNNEIMPIGDSVSVKSGDQVYFFVFDLEKEAASDYLTENGWKFLEEIDRESYNTSLCQIEL